MVFLLGAYTLLFERNACTRKKKEDKSGPLIQMPFALCAMADPLLVGSGMLPHRFEFSSSQFGGIRRPYCEFSYHMQDKTNVYIYTPVAAFLNMLAYTEMYTLPFMFLSSPFSLLYCFQVDIPVFSRPTQLLHTVSTPLPHLLLFAPISVTGACALCNACHLGYRGSLLIEHHCCRKHSGM